MADEIEQEDIDADEEYNDERNEDRPGLRVIFMLLGENDNHADGMMQEVIDKAEEVGFFTEHVFTAELEEREVPEASPLSDVLKRKR